MRRLRRITDTAIFVTYYCVRRKYPFCLRRKFYMRSEEVVLRIAKLTSSDAEGATSHSCSLADRPEPGAAVSLRCRVELIMPLACSSRIRAKRQSQARGGPGIFRLYCPFVIADRRTVSCDLCFRFSRSVLSLLLVPQKAASAAGGEVGMDCGTALAKQARLSPYREALRRRTFARRRAPRAAAEGRVAEKRLAISQFGSAPKALKRLDSRKKETWSSFPLALNFLPNDLDFPSPGFGNPSHALWQVLVFRVE